MILFTFFGILIIGVFSSDCISPDRINSVAQSLLLEYYPGVMDSRLNDLARQHATDLNIFPRDCDDISTSWLSHPLNDEPCCTKDLSRQDCLQQSLDYMGLTGTLKMVNEVYLSYFDEHGVYLFIKSRVPELGNEHTAYGIGVDRGVITYYTLETTDELMTCDVPPLENPGYITDYCHNPDPLVEAAVGIIKERFPERIINSQLMKAAQMHTVDALFNGRRSECNTSFSWLEHPSDNLECCDDNTSCAPRTMDWLGYNGYSIATKVDTASDAHTMETVIQHVNNVRIVDSYPHIGIGVFTHYIFIYTAAIEGVTDECSATPTTTTTTSTTTTTASSSITTTTTTTTSTENATTPSDTTTTDNTTSDTTTTTTTSSEEGTTPNDSTTSEESSTSPGDTTTTQGGSIPTETTTTISSAYSVAYHTTAVAMALLFGVYV